MRNNHTDNPFSVLNLSAVHSRETGSATSPVAPFGIFVWITTSNMRAYVRFFLPTFVYAAALIAASSTTASAQTFRSDAPSEANLTSFGGAVAINGDQIFVGEARNNVKPGTVHVFAKQGSEWTVVEELEAEDGEVNDRFGSAVAAEVLEESVNDATRQVLSERGLRKKPPGVFRGVVADQLGDRRFQPKFKQTP